MKNGFIFYDSFYRAIARLKPEEQSKCLKTLCDYALQGIMPDETADSSVLMFFELIKPQIDKNNQRYENGLKGGRPKNQTKPKRNQNEPNETKIEKQKPKEKDNVKDKVKEKDNVKDKEIKKENSLAVKPPAVTTANRTLSLPQQVYEYFASKYKQLSGKDYLPDKKDFILLAELIKNFGIDEVKQRIDWLEIGCRNGIFWFAKEQNDFTIGKLRKFWNEILPKLTDEQRKQAQQKRKEEEMQKRIEANLEAEEQIRRQTNVGNIGRV